MTKHIAIFCDGTWNRDDAPHPTNVVRMAQAVKFSTQGADGEAIKQQVIYLRGVGAGQGAHWMARQTDKVVGGAFGWGITQNIEDAYRALVFSYELGDQIYIFGFSRGAYTARSLAGLIRSCGIPPRDKVGEIPRAIARYRSRKADTHPNTEESNKWRLAFSPQVATSQDELDWRNEQDDPGTSRLLKIRYLGVWDTVGALGVPGFLSVAPLFNKNHQFHDTDLSSSVVAARHAVAVDERRKTFPPSNWKNLKRLNNGVLGRHEDTPLKCEEREQWKYRQEWFPGDHGSVGGGGERDGISAETFAWIAAGAEAEGLEMREDKKQTIAQNRDVKAPLVNTASVGFLKGALKLVARDRDGPDLVHDVAAFTVDRIGADQRYRPKTLSKVMDAILAKLG